jgi:hypothetical protein
MVEDRPASPTPREPATTPAPGGRRPPPPLYWLLPVLALVIGLVLGGLLVGVARDGDDSAGDDVTSADSSPTATPSPTPTGDLTVRAVVPAECVEAADQASAALESVDRGLTALRELDTSQLRDVLSELERAQPEIRELAQQCREEAQLPTISPTP